MTTGLFGTKGSAVAEKTDEAIAAVEKELTGSVASEGKSPTEVPNLLHPSARPVTSQSQSSEKGYNDCRKHDFVDRRLSIHDVVGGANDKVQRYGGSYGVQKDIKWDSGLTIISKPKVIIPVGIVEALLHINEHFKTEEFSICAKFSGEDEIILKIEDMFIPKQKVTSGSIDYLEDIPAGYAVIHKHPVGCNSFSGTDNEYINSNTEVSILYIPPFSFPMCIVNYTLPSGSKVQVAGSPSIYSQNHPTFDIKKIERGVSYGANGYNGSAYTGNYGSYGSYSKGGSAGKHQSFRNDSYAGLD